METNIREDSVERALSVLSFCKLIVAWWPDAVPYVVCYKMLDATVFMGFMSGSKYSCCQVQYLL